ncbi:HNH endonuclease [Paraburkholderia steynii]|uniref:Putative HNH nuclease YajD n=1 Tax=Paraburkholderia steynii TaxID=1245441 RepID=A0A4R0XHV6_9BURK|nr:HNH endonuclease [Paraburkholderia steynii]
MPNRPWRPCVHPGCGALVNGKDGYCPEHLKARRRRENEVRPTTAERGYGGAWRKAREAYLRAHPLCMCDECNALGRVLPATVVDHVIPHRGDMRLFWDSTNWQAMSKRCHDRKTATHDGGFGNVPRSASGS